jgi:RNA polymerase sigma factor (sigma-70 family)
MSRLLSTLVLQLRSAAQPSVDRVSDAELLARFVRNRDSAAFELLFWRHGPMIWGVCRRLLGNSPDAEDAYQAVFVILARKAASIGRGEALAGWLHRVAHRTALNARIAQRRRSAHERSATELPDVPAHDSPLGRSVNQELKDLLDQELLKLPEKFRQPVLLCDLEDRSHEEAAVVLNCPLGTLNSRLARGRQKLKERLLSRGVALTAVAVAAAPPAVSAAALEAVLRAPSASVRALADGAIHALTMSAMKKIAVGMILCGMLFAGLAYGATFAARKATTAAAPLAGRAVAVDEAGSRPEAAAVEQQAVIIGKVVDEAGKPVAGATVSAPGLEKSRPVTSGSDGGFRLLLGYPASDRRSASLLGEDASGRLGYCPVFQKKPQPVQVVLKPAHEIHVLVTGGDKKPVVAAEVSILADLAVLRRGRTDAEGRWNTRVPVDVKEWAVFARKGKAGFNYAVSQDYRSPESKPKALPVQLQLSLDGARTLRVKTVDREGKPIRGVKVGPWYIQMPGHEGDINLGGTSADWPATAKDGTALLDWLPNRFVRAIPILTYSGDYYAPDHATSLNEDKPTDEMTITLLPMEQVSGRVTHSDGRAAAGIEVTVEGQGGGNSHFRRSIRTGPDGRYTMKVYSEQAYIIAVTDDRWAAPYRGGLVVRVDKPVEGVDFVLGRATRLRGRVTVGKAGTPVAGTALRVDIDLGQIPRELRRKDDRIYHAVQMSFHIETDKDGRYELPLGPGVYKLYGPSLKEKVPVTIPTTNPPAEIVRDFHMSRPEKLPLAGRVVDAEGRPLPSITVWGRYAADTVHWFREVKTDAQGRFNVVRGSEPLVLYARTSDRSRAGLLRIDADAAKATLTLGPLASATGRLLDLEGKPLPAKKLRFGIRIYLGDSDNSPFSDSFGGMATTDEKGRFTLEGLIPGESYVVSLPLDENRLQDVTRVQAKSASPKELGDLRVNPEPSRPYVPPTAAERTVKAFAQTPSTTPAQRKARILAEAARECTRPMLLFGQPKDPASIELYRLFNEDAGNDGEKGPPSPSKLRWEFELASLDTDKLEVRKLAADLGVTAGKAKPPVLSVLNDDGSLSATFPLVLDDRQKLDGSALCAFLVKHKPPTRDAEKLLAEALGKAKAEDRRVFFIASASWCGPCRVLSRYLSSRKDVLQKHYIFVKLDISRDRNAEAVRRRYQEKPDSSVPWYAILDANGKMLASSSVPQDSRGGKARNIGYPSSPADVEYFVKMIERTAPRMSKEEIGELRKALR